MPSFSYVAKSGRGDERSGMLAAATIDEAVQVLHDQGLMVVNVREARGASSARSFLDKMAHTNVGSISVRALALFTRQFATVLEAGIPLARGLRGLAADASGRVMRRAIGDVAARIEGGSSISDAMAAQPGIFNKMYLSLVRAGERAGTLDAMLDQLAVYLEKTDAIRTKVRSAMAYPVFVLVFVVLAGIFLLLKVVPAFDDIYTQLGQQLPALTRAVVAASAAIRANVLASIVITLAVILTLYMVTRTRSGRYAKDLFLIRMPLFGPIIRKAVMSRFARTFGVLTRSGLPILEALELVKGAAGNEVVSKGIDDAKRSIEQGHGVTASFRATGKFPEMVLQMMATGEESGQMDAMLLKVSDFYDREVEAAVEGLASLIEPAMIVIVGALIGIIVVAMFLPIFYMGDAIMKGGANM
ncbi:MAG: type II secretion system F family protein [Candidatus Eisenbacteria bacterium]